MPSGGRYDRIGVHGMHVMENGHTIRVVTTEPEIGPATEPTLADLSRTLTTVYGTDFGVHDPTWISRFSDATRQATSYRSGRVLIAGDAAHIHAPSGGQGIGLGVQDAVNLGWKLAQVVHGISPDDLLDTYQAERHPVTARVLEHTMAQSFVQRSGSRIDAVKDLIADLLVFDGPRRLVAGLLSGLDVAYGSGEGDAPAPRPPHARPRPHHARRRGTRVHPAPGRPSGAARPGPAVSTSARGRTASGTSKRRTTERGSCR